MALLNPPSPEACNRCGQPFTADDTVTYNSDGEAGHATKCEPSEEYATQQMDRLSRYLFGSPTSKENEA